MHTEVTWLLLKEIEFQVHFTQGFYTVVTGFALGEGEHFLFQICNHC